MSQNSVSSVILRFALDEQSQRRVLKGVGDIEQVLSQTRRRIVSVEDAAAGLNAEFADLARATGWMFTSHHTSTAPATALLWLQAALERRA